MAEEIIYEVRYDTEAAQKNLVELVREQVKLRDDQRELTKAYKNGEIALDDYARELAANQTALKNNSKEQLNQRKILDTTNNSLNAQRKRLSELKKEYGDIDKSTKQGRKRFQELGKEIKTLNDDIKEQEEAVGVFSRSVGDYTNSILEAVGQTQVFGVSLGSVAKGARTATTAVAGTTGSLKLLKAALAATGIGAILVALGSLITFLSQSQKGVDLWNRALAGVSATVGVVTDRVARLGGILFDVFTGRQSIVEGAKAAAEALKGVGDEIQREVNLAIELERRSQDLRRARLGFIQTEAVLQASIEQTRLATEDASRADQERLQSAQAAQTLINSLFDARKRNLQEELDILKQQIALTDETTRIEDLEKQSELQTQIFLLEKDRAAQLKEVQNQENSLKKAIEERQQKQLEDEFKLFQARNENIELLKEAREEETESAIERLEKIADAGVAAAQRESQALSQQVEKRKQIMQDERDAKLFFAQSAFDLAAGLVREESILHKVFATGRAAVSTYEAAANALRLPLPPPLPQLFAGLYIAQGLGYVAQISGIQFAEGGVIPDSGGQILRGPSHANGGIRVEAEGGEPILTKNVSRSPYLLGLASQINEMAGGKPLGPRSYMQAGGIAVAQASSRVNGQIESRIESERSFDRVIRNLPPGIVLVKDIRKNVGRAVDVENRAKIG